jgi:hypothetical protein
LNRQLTTVESPNKQQRSKLPLLDLTPKQRYMSKDLIFHSVRPRYSLNTKRGRNQSLRVSFLFLLHAFFSSLNFCLCHNVCFTPIARFHFGAAQLCGPTSPQSSTATPCESQRSLRETAASGSRWWWWWKRRSALFVHPKDGWLTLTPSFLHNSHLTRIPLTTNDADHQVYTPCTEENENDLLESVSKSKAAQVSFRFSPPPPLSLFSSFLFV